MLPAPAADGAGSSGRNHAVILKLIVIGRIGRIVAVIVFLQVDLQGVILAGIRVDPEIEVIGTAEVHRVGATEAAEKPGHAARSPAGLQ